MADALQALRLLRSSARSFAVIILDLSLPGIDGFEFLQRLRQQPTPNEITIIVLTSSHNEYDRSRAHDYQVAAYLLKDELDPSGTQLLHLLSACRSSLTKPRTTRSVTEKDEALGFPGASASSFLIDMIAMRSHYKRQETGEQYISASSGDTF